MASPLNALYCAVCALLFWSAVGLPVARRLVGAPLSLAFAPLLGWAMHSVVALLIFRALPYTTINISLVALASLVAGFLVARVDQQANLHGSNDPPFVPREASLSAFSRWLTAEGTVGIPWWAYVAAALIAMTCAAAVLPKDLGDAVALASPIFDHSKIAIIDEISRTGVPPGNPFFEDTGGSGRLAYYYLWYFSASELSRVTGVSGWEADTAMTFFSAFTSLSVMMALAIRFSGQRMASIWVVALAASAWARALIDWVFGKDAIEAWVPAPAGFAGWMFQAAWVPQHLASTSCVLCSIYLMNQLANRRSVLTALVLALVAAAGFEASTWVGGVVFALSCVVIVPILIMQVERSKRRGVIFALGAVALLTVLLAWQFLIDQASASATRHHGSPIGFAQFETLGEAIAMGLRPWLDQPAYWLLLLPIEFVGYYITGMIVMFKAVTLRGARGENWRRIDSFAALGIVALLVAGFLVSTLAFNNDLGWRAGLLASTVLITFAGAGIASWVQARHWIAVGAASVAIALGAVGTVEQIYGNTVGNFIPATKRFAQAPALWESVRRHSDENDRVANNPLALKEMTPWAVNISWSLLANRRSCFAGWELAQVYTSVPHDQLKLINAQFERVFAGRAESGDISDLANKYGCDVIVVTSEDGAWSSDPFSASDLYQLVDENPGNWRIYRRAGSHN